MTIGLDLSVIQTPHRMRGIGATAINFVKNIPESIKAEHRFVLYLYEKDREEALSVLDLSGLNYEVRSLSEANRSQLVFRGKLRRLNAIFNMLSGFIKLYKGDDRITNLTGIQSFLQFDQMRPLPQSKNVKTALVLYDIIPYVMEADYLWSYKTARNHQLRRRSALKRHFQRQRYAFKNRVISKRADLLIAISQHTKNDFVKYLGVNPSKITVVHLGVDLVASNTVAKTPKFNRYMQNSWGYFPEPVDLTAKPYLLFVGGADPRRKLKELVAAYNNLRAQGHDIRLVLVGDTMKGPQAIPTADTQEYVAASSYLEDIVFLGFVTDEQKDWLYQNTLAFVFPSVYEGFGLPVLEAMNYGARVITYENSSIKEVAGDLPFYAKDFASIFAAVKGLLDKDSPADLNKYRKATQDHLKSFSWSHTTTKIIKLLSQ
ncbi:MAG: hypothetical protein JWO35_162 [Candidatus Saccharibacteria bacterium]|nr:hypothetical protein [Candidatus Saccharibacteria bacterium]